MKTPILIVLLSLTLFACTYTRDVSNVSVYKIGETKIYIREQCRYPCHKAVLFVNLHDDETTSVQAAEQYLDEIGGWIINIDNNGERIVNFRHMGKDFSFDPNRIYNSAGVYSTITVLSPGYDESAANEVSKFAELFIHNYIDSSKLIISLHNNLDSSLSVISYKKSQEINNTSGKVFINPAMDADDFILTTDSSLFSRIKEKNINVVWENVDEIENDGSLSIYAGSHKIPYINVEAQHEHVQEQLAMIKVLEEIIKEYKQQID